MVMSKLPSILGLLIDAALTATTPSASAVNRPVDEIDAFPV
jgi:hypothetical protein